MLAAAAAAAAPPSLPSLPPAPPGCAGLESEGERCRIGLRLAPCDAGVCLEFDKPWFAAFINVQCEAHDALAPPGKCLQPSSDMLKYVTHYEYVGVGVVLTTGQQSQKANPGLPFSNAPSTDALHYFATAVNTTVRLRRSHTFVAKSSVDLYWINATYDDGGARALCCCRTANADVFPRCRRAQRDTMSRPRARRSLQTALVCRRQCRIAAPGRGKYCKSV